MKILPGIDDKIAEMQEISTDQDKKIEYYRAQIEVGYFNMTTRKNHYIYTLLLYYR